MDKSLGIAQLRQQILTLKDVQIWALEQQVKAQEELTALEGQTDESN